MVTFISSKITAAKTFYFCLLRSIECGLLITTEKKKRQKKETNQKGKKSHVEVLCVYTFPGGTYINDTFFLCFS